ncbi:putative fatty-acid--CoA ligase fadD25 [Mycolicibacterium madagascariense]|uniref:Putative fatty-acid--CoA ligase fadD25 n=1 Tax=Mycolicibacterium madagascariense TaxID=212765 RepID=A0A7I7XGM4_9MYCO|nr:AMP-binding protein [Mycolicibacterium madagascariense]MCV7013309.1 AMP-binding protein [Mycolicibacterium madagascariense]BBZ28362.1 putative fatty-acid--CoA ligase fadD25 [Mycolicibacterium madagascariense]
MLDSSIPAILRERASLQPNDPAFTFIDYDVSWDGVEETLTWSQLQQRVVSLAAAIREHADIGDRAVILAPQSMSYILGFLASFEANVIAVPLSTPTTGAHDERVSAVLRDARPTVVLTTANTAADVAPYATAQEGEAAPAVLVIDELDLTVRRRSTARRETPPETAYLQYTSGSTRTPAGVMVSQRNLFANFEQQVASLLTEYGKVAPPGTTTVSWLPFYHDMGLILGICAPILGGWHSVLMSPIAFLQRPARWLQQLGLRTKALTAAPNFALDLAAARSSDDDLAGIDLGDILAIICGAERVQPVSVKRFTQRLARFNFQGKAIRPSFGLAEATLFVATREAGEPPSVVVFDTEKITAGVAKRSTTGTSLISYGMPESPLVRIVDHDTSQEAPAGTIGEIWVHGDNVCEGYWNKPEETESTFRGVLATADDDIPTERWLRTGDLGFFSDGELFIVGRIKDLLIVRGRNHYPDDIEATVGAVSGGRVAAISVEEDAVEQLVAIIEMKERATPEETQEKLSSVRRDVIAAISQAHGISAADLVMVSRGSIPITTSGKIRRQACVEQYQRGGFVRMDA